MAAKIYRNLEEEPIKVPRFEEKVGFYTTKQRSKIMSKIKGKDSKPEVLLRKALWAKNLRFRIHGKTLPGKPDIVIKKYKLVIFIDGEFWHGYNWSRKKLQINHNTGYWLPKIERNIQRDILNNKKLEEMGYVVMRFWEHEVRKNLQACVNQIMLYVEAARMVRIPYRY